MRKDPVTIESQKIYKRKKGVIRANSDFFRTARYGLTVQEHRLIYYAILVGQQDKKPFEPVSITIKEFKEIFELKGESSYNEIRKQSKKIINKSVEVVYKDKDGNHLLQAPWLVGITYHAKDATVTIEPNKKLQPFFEGKPFTDGEYYFLMKFTSQYAERLYEILKSMPIHKKPIVDFDPADLAQRLTAPPSCRKNYNDFRKRVLDPAIKDINEFTDLEVDLREKRGQYNKVNIVFFSVTKKKVPKLADRIEQGEFIPPLSEEEQTRFMLDLLGEDAPNANGHEVQQIPGQLDFEGGIIGDE